QSWRDLPRNNPLDRIEVLGMIEKRSNVRIREKVPTEMELVLEQSQQGSNTLSWKPCQGGSSKLNLPVHKYSTHTVKRSSQNRRIRRWRYNLIPAESRFMTSCSIDKDKYMMKAQVHVSKSFAISDVQALPQKETLLTRLPNNINDNSIMWIKYYFFHYVVHVIMSKKMLREIVSKLSSS
nr:hypothetical protein [Tanacetum cinerariifolium]